MLFQKWSGIFFMSFFLLVKSNLALFVPCGEPSLFALYSLLLIVDFDSDTPTSWRVFFSWLDVVKGFFFNMERILHHCCPPWTSRPFYVAELTSAFFFFFFLSTKFDS